MSKSAQVVDGEASESDTEIEVGKSADTSIITNEVFVIAGEAPESDDESKILPRTSAELDLLAHRDTPVSPNRLIYTSLLHQKLWECNVCLRATIEGLVRHTTDISVEKLTSADKTLLSVQESMRSTNTNMAIARSHLKEIHAALAKANCSTALPTVKVKPVS